MQRPMRRTDRQIPQQEAMAILQQGEYGVLSTADETGQPYGIPLSYVVLDGRVYFHCAHKGHKIDNLQQNARVSFCVVGPTQPLFEGGFTTNFESAVLFGQVKLIEDEAQRRTALMALCEKYLPQHMDKAEHAMEKSGRATAVYSISIDSLSGKARRSSPHQE